jgi:hypothetical protein
MTVLRFVIATCCAIVVGSYEPNHVQAQWGPTCQSTAAAELQDTGAQINRVLGGHPNSMGSLALMQLGLNKPFEVDRPIMVATNVVGATVIARENVQTRCRVRATITISYTRTGVIVDRSTDAPTVREQFVDERFNTPIVYDMVFVESEILESDAGREVVKLIAEHALGRHRQERTPEVIALLTAQAHAQQRQNDPHRRVLREQQERDRERARSDAEQQALLMRPPAERPPITSAELSAITRWIERCYDLPIDARLPRGSLRIRVKFNLDGTVAARPEVLNPRPESNFQQQANAAVRAIMRCSAEGGVRLQRERYAAWAEVVLAF